MLLSEQWIAWMGLLGLLTGSLMNIVVYRLPRMIMEENAGLSLWWPGSHCTTCQHSLAWYDNVPLFSWLSLKGRCRYCHAAISWRYPATELFTMLGFAAIAVAFPPGLPAFGLACFFWFGYALSLIDLKTMLLPDMLTLPLLWLGLLYHSLSNTLPLPDVIYGAVAGYLSLWAVYHIFRLLTRREGLGYGDFKLLAACGAWCGWQSLPLILVIASLTGIVLTLCHTRHAGIHQQPVPFGPPLAIAGFILLCRLMLH